MGLTTILRLQRRAAWDAKLGWKSRENEKQDGGRNEGWSWHSRQLNAIMALIIVERRCAEIVLSRVRPTMAMLEFTLLRRPRVSLFITFRASWSRKQKAVK